MCAKKVCKPSYVVYFSRKCITHAYSLGYGCHKPRNSCSTSIGGGEGMQPHLVPISDKGNHPACCFVWLHPAHTCGSGIRMGIREPLDLH